MNLANAQVSIPLADLEEIRGINAKLVAEVADLKQAIVEQRLGGPETTARALLAALQHALPIVGYAIAMMPPLAFRGWPYQHLRDLVEALPALPGMPAEWVEVKNDFHIFARECERWEKARALGIEQELFAEENARKAVSVQMDIPPGYTATGLPSPGDDDGADGGDEGDAAQPE